MGNTAEAKEMPINISSPSANITFDMTSFASIPRDNERDLSDEELSPHLPDDEEMSPLLPEVKLTMCKNSAVGDEVQTVNRLQEPDSSCNSQTEDENETQVLDRFQHQGSSVPLCQSLVVEASVITDWSVSPFTGARLSPYVRRDTETEPSGLAVLRRFDSFATRLLQLTSASFSLSLFLLSTVSLKSCSGLALTLRKGCCFQTSLVLHYIKGSVLALD